MNTNTIILQNKSLWIVHFPFLDPRNDFLYCYLPIVKPNELFKLFKDFKQYHKKYKNTLGNNIHYVCIDLYYNNYIIKFHEYIN